jgi:hypothetical protein
LTPSDIITAVHRLGIKAIRLGVYQPKAAGYTEWVCSLGELADFAETLRKGAQRVRNAENAFGKTPREVWDVLYLNQAPSEKDCAFCRAMPTCPSKIKEVADHVFESPVIDASDFTSLEVPERPRSTDTEWLAACMAKVGSIEDWCKSVRAEVERRLLIGDGVPGFGLELGRQGARKFADIDAATALLKEKFRLKIDEIFDLELKSPTQLEKLTKGAEAAIGPRQWKQVEALITRSDPKLSVKPAASIKTPYVVPSVSADDFVPVLETPDDLY